MNYKNKLNIFMLSGMFFLTACGGGGGGGSSNQNTQKSSSSNQVQSSLSSSSSSQVESSSIDSSNSSSLSSAQSSSASVTNNKPGLTITFPRASAQLSSSKIKVRGLVSDDKGINQVVVNGVQATIKTVETSKLAAKPQLYAATESSLVAEQTLEWEVELDLAFGDTELNVEATDSDGATTTNQDQPITLQNYRLPLTLYPDRANNRFIGSDTIPQMYALDMDTFIPSVLPDGVYKEAAVINAEGTRLYSATVDSGFLNIYSLTLNSGLNSLEKHFDLAINSEIYGSAWVSGGAYDASANIYYLLLGYSDLNSSIVANAVYKYDISSATLTKISESDRFLWNLEFDGQYLYASSIPKGYSHDQLIRINPSSGEQTIFVENGDFNIISTNEDLTKIYALRNGDIMAIDISDGSSELVSATNQPQILNFSQVNNLIVDEAHHRLLVLDAGVRQVISVDLETGVRSYATANGIGDGQKIVRPENIAASADDKFIYALDDNFNSQLSLLKIELATGNRTLVADLSEFAGVGSGSFTLDEAHERGFVGNGLQVIAVDLVSGQTQVIAADLVGTGPMLGTISGLVYDQIENRLVVSSISQATIIAINPDTLARELLMDNTTGSGVDISDMADIAFDSSNNILYGLNQYLSERNKVIAMNLNTGERSVLVDTCLDAQQNNVLANYGRPKIRFDVQHNALLASGDNHLLKIDLASNSCTASAVPVMDMLYLSDGSLIASNFNQIEQVDFLSATAVTLSR